MKFLRWMAGPLVGLLTAQSQQRKALPKPLRLIIPSWSPEKCFALWLIDFAVVGAGETVEADQNNLMFSSGQSERPELFRRTAETKIQTSPSVQNIHHGDLNTHTAAIGLLEVDIKT